MSSSRSRSGGFRFAPFSLVMHLLLVLLVWLYVDEPTPLPLDDSKISADLFHIAYPKLDVRNEPEPHQQVTTTNPSPVVPLKPTFAKSSFAISVLSDVPSQISGPRVTSTKNRGAAAATHNPQPATLNPQPIAPSLEPGVALPRSVPADATEITMPLTNGAEYQRLDTDADLADGSPDARSGAMARSGVHRGDGGGFSWAAYGNADAQPGRSDGTFRGLMVDLARSIASRAEKDKLDIVFVVDATGSMQDNIRGIRAYLGHFAERMQRDGKNVAYGAVVFTDMIVEEPKAQGVTDDYNDVRNWLFHTNYLGGGDLAESGLEALIAAADDIDYRRGSERHLILVTDGPVHDADYDGQSAYTLDQVLEKLAKKKLTVDVVGIDYLTLKQIARSTGGQWYPIPGTGYLEDVPYAAPEKRLSSMGILNAVRPGRYEITVPELGAEWVEMFWKVLSPLGTVYQVSSPIRRATQDGATTFHIDLPIQSWPDDSFPYTLICHLTGSNGMKGILRNPVWLSEAR